MASLIEYAFVWEEYIPSDKRMDNNNKNNIVKCP